MNSECSQEEGLNLKILRAIALDLVDRLSLHLELPQAVAGSLALKLLGHLNLAALRLCPAPLAESATLIETLLLSLAPGDHPTLTADDSHFATLTLPLAIPRELLKFDLAAILLASVRSQIAAANCSDQGMSSSSAASDSQFIRHLNEMAADILTVGWAGEWLTLNSPAGKENAQKQTQIFTPEKIADFLAQEALKRDQDGASPAEISKHSKQAGAKISAKTILDPACGAGHLLIAAAESWLEANDFHSHSPSTAKCRLPVPEKIELMRKLLSENLFGLDIDPDITALAGLTIYFWVRRKLPIAGDAGQNHIEMPLPHIYAVSGGSLALGLIKTHGRDLRGKLVSLDNRLPQFFSCIVMNPPYQSARTIDDTTRDFLRKNYPDSSGDLYTAFIELGMRLLEPGGKLATIVQKSFLFIQRYRSLRLKMLRECHLKTMVDLGPGYFSSKPGEKVMSAILVLEKRSDRPETRATGEPGALDTGVNGRRISYGRHLERTQQISENCALQIIGNITGNPFALDCPLQLAALFQNLPSLGDSQELVSVNGLFTCNNKYFIKSKDQLTEEDLEFYVPYDKGGGKKWYHETDLYLRWLEGGEEIRSYRHSRGQSRSLPGEEFYFQPGLTYSYIGTKGFKARLLSAGSIFDIASSAIFTKKVELAFLLALFNSSLYIYLLSVLNPTINFQIGDIRRLPFKEPGDYEETLAELASEAVELTKSFRSSEQQGKKIKAVLIEKEAALQIEIDRLIFDLYEIAGRERQIIAEGSWVKQSRKNSLF